MVIVKTPTSRLGPPLEGAIQVGGTARSGRPHRRQPDTRTSGVGGPVPAPLTLGGLGRPLRSLGRGRSRPRHRGPTPGQRAGASCRSLPVYAGDQFLQWVHDGRQAFEQAITGLRRTSSPCNPVRVRVSRVCSRSSACSRQVSALAHVDVSAMGTLRLVGMRVSRRCTRSRPAWRAPSSGECACAGGGGGALLPRDSAASTGVNQRAHWHPAPCGDNSRQAKHTRRPL